MSSSEPTRFGQLGFVVAIGATDWRAGAGGSKLAVIASAQGFTDRVSCIPLQGTQNVGWRVYFCGASSLMNFVLRLGLFAECWTFDRAMATASCLFVSILLFAECWTFSGHIILSFCFYLLFVWFCMGR